MSNNEIELIKLTLNRLADLNLDISKTIYLLTTKVEEINKEVTKLQSLSNEHNCLKDEVEKITLNLVWLGRELDKA